MYNKEELINAMLDKRLPKIYSHITSLKDVKDLIITNITQNEEKKIICPISKNEFSGLNSFYFFWNCGCLISKRAFDELKMSKECVYCGKDFDKEIVHFARSIYNLTRRIHNRYCPRRLSW